MWPFKRKPKQPKFAPPRGEVQYIEEPSYNFRYRPLDSTVDDGFAAAAAQLLPNEKLYRMMGGDHLIDGKLNPFLICDEVNFDFSVAELRMGRCEFQLAAGVPATSQDRTSSTRQASGVS